jgi:hypothetical protein
VVLDGSVRSSAGWKCEYIVVLDGSVRSGGAGWNCEKWFWMEV